MARGIRTAIVILCMPAALLMFFLVPSTTAIIVTDTRGGGILFCARLAEGEEFELSYIHSVNKRPVLDTMAMGRGCLAIVRSAFDSFGAGMPDISGAEGRLAMDLKGRLLWIVNRHVPEVSLFVGRVAEHALEVRGHKVLLAGLAQPGTSVTFKPKKISLYELWRGRCLR